jgi:hypothetical protein
MCDFTAGSINASRYSDPLSFIPNFRLIQKLNGRVGQQSPSQHADHNVLNFEMAETLKSTMIVKEIALATSAPTPTEEGTTPPNRSAHPQAHKVP